MAGKDEASASSTQAPKPEENEAMPEKAEEGKGEKEDGSAKGSGKGGGKPGGGYMDFLNGVIAQAAAKPPIAEASGDDPTALSVKQLKAELAAAGVSTVGATEKADLVQLLVEARSKAAEAKATEATTEPEVREAEPGVWVIGPSAEEDGAAAAASGSGADAGKKPSDDKAKKAADGKEPSVMDLMFGAGNATKGPNSAGVVKDFAEHLDKPLKEMAAIVATKWKEANGVGANVQVDSKVVESSANKSFNSAFTEGFAVQCLQVVTGPPAPIVLFKFRHVGKFVGKYVDADGTVFEGTGKPVDMEGMCNATLLPGQPVSKIELYYNPPNLLKALSGELEAGDSCPVSGKIGSCPLMG